MYQYQTSLFEKCDKHKRVAPAPFKLQLLKWIGNKQRFAHEILSWFPENFGTYYEPFLGSGAVLGTLAPSRAVASDALKPLAEIWMTLSKDPNQLLEWYSERWNKYQSDRNGAYEEIKNNFSKCHNPADLLFLSRLCYGGVVRFRMDGFMSTPIGVHKPIEPNSMENRINVWHNRTKGTKFYHSDFEAIIDTAKEGDLVYCDPPYSDSQSILYGAQKFTLQRLFQTIARAKNRGVFVALSIDGLKKSGSKTCDILYPSNLFEQSVMVNCGRSMLRRFQMEGQTLETEEVSDRLLLTWKP